MLYDLSVAYMRVEKMQTGFLLESVKQRYLLEGLGADDGIILNCILSTWWEGMTGLSKERANVVM